MRKFLFITCLTVAIISCKKDSVQVDPIDTSKPLSEYDAAYATSFADIELELIKKTSGYVPPVSSRAIGFTWLAYYEATVYGMKNYQSLQSYLNIQPALPLPDRRLTYDWAIAGNAALPRMMKKIFFNASTALNFSIDSIEQVNLAALSAGLDSDLVNRSVQFGRAIADSIFEWSKTDGGHLAQLDLFPSYTPPIGNEYWVPTPAPVTSPYFNNKPALLYYWGNVRPFIPENIETDALLPPPPAFSSDTNSDFYKEIKKQYDSSFTLSAEQIQIARFWADENGTYSPPGHSLSITSTIIKTTHCKLDKASIALLKVGICVHDAFINCFKIKYTYNLLRPVTYIRNYIDPTWITLIGTPPFPEYASCHSTQSAASAEVLSKIFGEAVTFTDNSKDYIGYPARSFTHIHDFAKEAAMSRYYGGVHYMFSCNLGYENGIVIGQNVDTYLPVKK